MDEVLVELETDAVAEDVLEKTVEVRAAELEAALSSWRMTLDDMQCSAIFWLYQLSKGPELQRHQTVEPPIARLSFAHFENPPV